MSELHIKFGKLLEVERQRLGVSLGEISAELKIPETTLTNVEEGNIDELPSELYYNLFAKSYAEFLGIDFVRTTEAIQEEIGESLASQTKQTKEEEKNRPTESDDDSSETEVKKNGERAFVKKLIILSTAIVVVFALFLTIYKMFFESAPETEVDALDSIETTSEEAPGHGSEPAQNYSNYQWSTPPDSDPDSLLLTLTAREQSWATIFADGDTAIYRTLVPWREYTVKARYRLLVSIGIPSRVETKLDGRLVNLADSETGRISRVQINQTNKEQIGFIPDNSSPEQVQPNTELQNQDSSNHGT